MKASVIAVAALLMLTAAACGTDATTPTGSASSPAAAAGAALGSTSQASALGAYLSDLTYAAQSFTFEPKADVTKADVVHAGALLLVSAKLLAVDAGKGTITFDAVQTFTGAAALREQRADGVQPVGSIYHRNRHRHVQTLPLAPHCAIVLQHGVGSMQAVNAKELQANEAAVPGWYWLVIGADGVNGMLQQAYN
jgi:hypothetical protein